MNPYKVLGLETSASKQEIKKAYFRLIRTYTPEKQPEKFMEIREAYEYLQDESNRSHIEAISTIPQEFQKPYEQVLLFMQANDYEKAASLCQEVLHIASIEAFEVLLGTCYIETDNPGKAINTWENLCKNKPDNLTYLENLGDAYATRGWTKKALQVYQNLAKVQPASIKLYTNLISALGDSAKDMKVKLTYAHKLFSHLENMTKISKEEHEDLCIAFISLLPDNYNNKNAPILNEIYELIFPIISKYCLEITDYFRVMIDCLDSLIIRFKETSSLEGILQQYLNFLDIHRTYLSEHEAAQLSLMEWILEGIYLEKNTDIHPHFSENAHLIYSAKYIGNISSSEKSYADILLDGIPSDMANQMLWDLYLYYANNLDKFRPTLKIVKENYPILSSIIGDILDEMISGKQKSLIYKCEKNLKKFSKSPSSGFFDPSKESYWDLNDSDDYYDYVEPEPYKRESPKVGRNDPCPCGSGKKYKKCCGK